VLATDLVEQDRYQPRPGGARELIDYVELDLERDTLDDLARSATTIVHAAALTPADEGDGAVGDTLLRVNLAPLPALLRAARTSQTCSRLVFVSSAGVFDQSREAVLREEDADGGASLYGAAKLAAEIVSRRYASHYGLEAAFVRPTSLFGAGERPRPSRPQITSLARLVDHARRGEAVCLERETSRTDWLSVDDAADAVRLLCQASSLDGSSYNLSSGRPRPFAEVAAAVAAVAGLELDAASTAVVDGGSDRPARIANDRISAALDWHPARTLEDGIRDLLDYLDFLDGVEQTAPSARAEL